jgi:AraC family transcriptional regulator
MPEFTLTRVAPRTYLYVEGRATMDPGAISEAMGRAFEAVMDFRSARHRHRRPAALGLLRLQPRRDRLPRRHVRLRGRREGRSGRGEGGADPGGEVLHFTHVGSYATLRDDYGLMMEHVAARGLSLGAPTWEVYVDDPETTPEHRLRTEVYVTLG